MEMVKRSDYPDHKKLENFIFDNEFRKNILSQKWAKKYIEYGGARCQYHNGFAWDMYTYGRRLFMGIVPVASSCTLEGDLPYTHTKKTHNSENNKGKLLELGNDDFFGIVCCFWWGCTVIHPPECLNLPRAPFRWTSTFRGEVDGERHILIIFLPNLMMTGFEGYIQ